VRCPIACSLPTQELREQPTLREFAGSYPRRRISQQDICASIVALDPVPDEFLILRTAAAVANAIKEVRRQQRGLVTQISRSRAEAVSLQHPRETVANRCDVRPSYSRRLNRKSPSQIYMPKYSERAFALIAEQTLR